MLRTSNGESAGRPAGADAENALPGTEEAFATVERALGIRFYRVKDGFYFPYHGLQSMTFTPKRITLRFSSDDVIVDGRGLHRLYVGLAEQTVHRIVQQTERGGAGTVVTGIERVPRTTGGSQEAREAPGKEG